MTLNCLFISLRFSLQCQGLNNGNSLIRGVPQIRSYSKAWSLPATFWVFPYSSGICAHLPSDHLTIRALLSLISFPSSSRRILHLFRFSLISFFTILYFSSCWLCICFLDLYLFHSFGAIVNGNFKKFGYQLFIATTEIQLIFVCWSCTLYLW